MKRFKKLYCIGFMALVFFSQGGCAFAKSVSTSSTTYAWEKGLSALTTSLQGPIAATVAVAAFALCTWQIIRGAELSSWVAPMIVAALAVATLVNADTLIETLSGTTVNGFESAAVLEASPQRGAAEDLIGPSCPLR